jgi:thymidylate kinase
MGTQPSLRRPSPTPLLVSFSGLDGSGKSTQIENLRACLDAAGYRVKQLAFWDNVVVLSRYREDFVHKAYNSEKGVGAPGKPVQRRDKNVRRWYLTLARHALYFLDALHLAWVVERAYGSGADVIILDRYIYDEWANLPLKNQLTRVYIRLVEAMVPRPDVAYLLDADPVAACMRKPEYPLNFMRQCRTAYHMLADILGTMTTIPPLPLDQVKMAVEGAMRIALADEIGLSRPASDRDRIEQLPAA